MTKQSNMPSKVIYRAARAFLKEFATMHNNPESIPEYCELKRLVDKELNGNGNYVKKLEWNAKKKLKESTIAARVNLMHLVLSNWNIKYICNEPHLLICDCFDLEQSNYGLNILVSFRRNGSIRTIIFKHITGAKSGKGITYTNTLEFTKKLRKRYKPPPEKWSGSVHNF